jgi:hypothetical protein
VLVTDVFPAFKTWKKTKDHVEKLREALKAPTTRAARDWVVHSKTAGFALWSQRWRLEWNRRTVRFLLFPKDAVRLINARPRGHWLLRVLNLPDPPIHIVQGSLAISSAVSRASSDSCWIFTRRFAPSQLFSPHLISAHARPTHSPRTIPTG